MSLKAFHIVFLVCAILLAFFCAGLLFHDYAASHNGTELGVAIVSLVSGLLLLVYGRAVLRKLKHISYL